MNKGTVRGMKNLDLDKQAALLKLGRAVKSKQTAKAEYDEAIRDCIELRVTNTGMAAVAGVSEAAIRMYRKRNNL